MQSALIVYCKPTKEYAELMAKAYKDVEFFEVEKPPTEETLKIKSNKDIIIGIGGGSVIDTAKIISREKRCIAIPTTAAGASMTPYATIWGEKKISIPTRKPILLMKPEFLRDLPFNVRQSTKFDALSHAIESFWSKKATSKSKEYSKKAIQLINEDTRYNDINTLITAGNFAGQAIAITGTNIVHAVSYPITIEYGIDHGTTCGMVLPHVIEYIDFRELPGLFGLRLTQELIKFLKKSFIPPKLKIFDPELVAEKALRYPRIHDGPREIEKNDLLQVLEKVRITIQA